MPRLLWLPECAILSPSAPNSLCGSRDDEEKEEGEGERLLRAAAAADAAAAAAAAIAADVADMVRGLGSPPGPVIVCCSLLLLLAIVRTCTGDALRWQPHSKGEISA
jgi:hypothetical protein